MALIYLIVIMSTISLIILTINNWCKHDYRTKEIEIRSKKEAYLIQECKICKQRKETRF